MDLNTDINCLIIRAEGLSERDEQRIRDIYTQYGKKSLYEYFKVKKILPFAAKTFSRLKLDKDFWTSILEEYRERNRKIITFLDEAYAVMDAHGAHKVFLSENFGALLSVDGDIGLFASGDTDNCYAPEEKNKIYQALVNIGCTYRETYSYRRLNGTAFFPPARYGLPEGFYLGTQPTPLSRLKLPSFVNMEDFDGWRDTYYYKNTHIRLANPTALMYICILHISLHSFSRAPDIRLYSDLLNMSKTNVDYDEIVDWCKKNKTQTRVSVATTLSNALIKTNIPIKVTNQTYRKNSVLKRVYDTNINYLINEPHGLKVLAIEIHCDDEGVIHGICKLAFPDKIWLSKTYGSTSLLAYFKHVRRLLF